MSDFRRDDRGSGSALVATAGVLLVVGIGCAVVLAGSALTAHRARAAADLAALAGAQVVVNDLGDTGRACPAAGEIAARNLGTLVDCIVVGGATSPVGGGGVPAPGDLATGSRFGWPFAVSVTVSKRLPWRLPGVQKSVAATAHAGVLG